MRIAVPTRLVGTRVPTNIVGTTVPPNFAETVVPKKIVGIDISTLFHEKLW